MRWLGLLLLLSPLGLHAADIYDCYNGSAEQGGNFVSVNGINALQYVQQSFPGAQVDVFVHNTVTHATLYQDGAGTIPLANPFSASNHGVAFVCAADGRYDFQYSQGGITTPFTVSDIKFCFACSGGGGGGVNPGTPFQVTRYDPTGANIQNSSISDNPANGPSQASNGLSVTANGLAKFGVNSPNGTTLNLLVCTDTTITTMTQVTTCPAPIGTNKTFGVADNGAGITGNVEIYDHGYHACLFDGQTVINDYVGPSASVPGDCADVGPTKPSSSIVIGRVTSLNTGIGTLATVDLQPWDTISGPGGSGTVNNCGSANSNAFYLVPGTAVNCDPLVTDDNAGNVGAQSLALNNNGFAGFLWQKQGPQPPATPANTILTYPPTAVTTYSMQQPGAAGSANQCYEVVSTTTDTNGNVIDVMGFGPCGSGGVPTTQIANPTAPTLTNQNAAGARSITYLVVALESDDGTWHSAASATQNIANANASPQVLLTAYGDTLYGARCFDIYITADSGGRALGKLAHCVGKKWLDNATQVGDGTTAPAVNNSILSVTMNHSPGCNIPQGGILGRDAPPCSPNALDAENGETFGVPADTQDPFWTWGGGGTSPCTQGAATASWTGGSLILNSDTTSQLNCLVLNSALPATPYTFEVYMDETFNSSAAANGTFCSLGLRESSTGKMTTISLDYASNVSVGGTVGYALAVDNWTSSTSNSHVLYWAYNMSGLYLKIQNTGSNIVYSFSNNGNGLGYGKISTQAITTPFTTAPNQLFIGAEGFGNQIQCTVDFLRRTQ